MLQIHSYAQLAHGAVVTLTTVEGRCEKGLSFSWASLHRGLSNPFISEKKLNFLLPNFLLPFLLNPRHA